MFFIHLFEGQKPQLSRHFDRDQFFFTCSLPGSVKDDTKCSLYIGETSRPFLTTTTWRQMTSTKQRFCQFTVAIDDLQNRLHLVQQNHASCDYSLGHETNSLSLRSDRYNLTGKSEKSWKHILQ